MKQKKLLFNKVKDLSPVSQFGYVDLVEAMVNNVVPANLQIQDNAFNDVDDPRAILGKPSDVFDAYKMASYIASRGRKSKDNPPS